MVRLNYLFIIFITITFALATCSCGGSGYASTDDYTADDSSDKGGKWVSYNIKLKNLSGLCYNPTKTALLAAVDKGSIYEVSFDGKVLRRLPFNGLNDFEAITVNFQTGDIYLNDEFEMKVFKLSSDQKSLSEVVKIDIPNAVPNKGIEGLAYGRDTLYIANQESPTRLFKYCLTTKKLLYKDLTFATFLSDVCYDETDNTLWFVDSKKQRVSHCNLNGDVLATQNIPMVDKAEALYVDRENNIMWIGCDKTGTLYKIDLKI